MSILGEAVLTASVELLLNKLASSELLSFARHEQMDADLKKWESILVKIYAVLEDAEEKQMTNQFVKKWLVDLKNLAYDIEDILDEFSTQVLERKLSSNPESSTSKVCNLIPTCSTSFNPRFVKFNVKMGSEIKKITERLQEIVAQKNNLQLLDSSEGRSNKVRDQRLPTTSLTEDHVYGREKDQEAIVELLLKDDGNEEKISVIPIIGIGGVGKTTLAQNVYNDDRVKSHFDLQAWACVSDDFDVINVTRTILQSVSSSRGDSGDLNQLQVELKERLSNKKFCIVLDDIWNENYDKWTVFFRPFRVGSKGSKIIVTTRSDHVSSMVGTFPTYTLKELSFHDSLSIFAHHSLGRKNFSEHEDLKEIGEKIVSKCKGLPLAVKTLGGLLRCKVNRKDWEHVLNSKIWNLPVERSDILPALRLSYHYLPPQLKRCFAYCSLFPKDYEFQKKELVLLWMAEGFLQQESNETQMEDVGDDYFEELQSRSFFQRSSNITRTYVMHDLINDLAQWVAGEIFFFRLENMVESSKQNNISRNLRHFSYVSGRDAGIKMFEIFYGVNNHSKLTYNGGLYDGAKMLQPFNDFKHLRTFIMFKASFCHLTHDILKGLTKLRCLRALSLDGLLISELPDSIGDLKHLRFLNLSHTRIQFLPKSVSRLYNLQTLNLMDCRCLRKLCPNIENLINLRYLNLSFTELGGMPVNIGKLTRLQTLTNFVVSNSTFSGLKELKFLKHLQGRLTISGLENVINAMDAKDADLNGKTGLTGLYLGWSGDSKKAEIQTQALEMLRPYQKLEELSVSGYGGLMFPSWLGDTSLSNLVRLTFINCGSCIILPSIGQLPSLKELFIRRMARIKMVGQEFYGNGCSRPFPSLEILCLADMQEWEDWISDGFSHEVEVFPRLQDLSIVACSKLRGKLPEHLPSLKRLAILRCEQLQVSIQSLPAGCRFEIDGCKQVQWRSNTTIGLNSLYPAVFQDFSGYIFLTNYCKQRLSRVEEVEIIGYKEPTSFWYGSVVSLLPQHAEVYAFLKTSLSDDHVPVVEEEEENVQQHGFPNRCQYLMLKNCVCLEKLPRALHNLSFLKALRIESCSDVVSFPDCGLPSELKSIYIGSCDALVSLPSSWMDSTSLEQLHIQCCKSFTYIARDQLPPNLKRLMIACCDNLLTLMQVEEKNLQSSTSGIGICPSTTSFLTKGKLPDTLEYVSIYRCSNLASCSSSGNLPKALKVLIIAHCSQLELIKGGVHNNTLLDHLESIDISDWPGVVCFLQGGLPPANLQKFSLTNCEKLEALPNNMHQLMNLISLVICSCEKLEAMPNHMQNLVSLRELCICNCPNIKSFPEDGFPTSLTSLRISNLKIFEPLFRWVLHKLTSLTELYIEGWSDVVCFPPQETGIMLPTSLINLGIEDFPNLKCLSFIIQNLNSLERLSLVRCPQLKLFPEKGLPVSLLRLYIRECPLLNQKCKRRQYWNLIAYIPEIDIE